MADTKEAVEGEEEAGKKSKLPLIIGAVVVVLAAAGGAYFMGLFGGGAAEDEAAEPTAEEQLGHAPAQYIPFKPEFVANYKIDGRTHYLKILVAVMVREDEARLAVEQHMPFLRNQLVMLFANSDFQTLKTLEGKAALREEALKVTQEVLQKELGSPGIEQVLFTDFVLQ